MQVIGKLTADRILHKWLVSLPVTLRGDTQTFRVQPRSACGMASDLATLIAVGVEEFCKVLKLTVARTSQDTVTNGSIKSSYTRDCR